MTWWPFRSTRQRVDEIRSRTGAAPSAWPWSPSNPDGVAFSVTADFTAGEVRVTFQGKLTACLSLDAAASLSWQISRAVEALRGLDITDQVEANDG